MNPTITAELQLLIDEHIKRFCHYVQYDLTDSTYKVDTLLSYFRDLERIIHYPAHLLTQDLYNLAFSRYIKIKDFLMLMGLHDNETYQQGKLGQLYNQTLNWLTSSTVSDFRITTHDVWDLIAPVAPDRLTEVEVGIFEAVWWFPVPQMDIEILQRTEGVEFIQDVPSTSMIRNGKAIRFSILPNEHNAHEE